MSRFNTGNPLGSGSPLDLDDNAKNLDVLTNSREAFSNPDRFGVQRKTWHGMERDYDAAQSSRDDQFHSAQSSREAVFSDFLQASGYQDLGEYAPGIEITDHNQYVIFGGQPYLLKPSIPVPYTTSGEWTGDDFRLIGDDSLRQDLANPDKGAAMVGRGVVAVDSIADLLALPEGQRKAGLRYLVKGYHAGTDVGGGEFYWDTASSEAENLGTVFGASASGRWKRLLGDYITPYMFGAIADGATDDSDAFWGAYGVDHVPCVVAGTLRITRGGVRKSNKTLMGSNPGATILYDPVEGEDVLFKRRGGNIDNSVIKDVRIIHIDAYSFVNRFQPTKAELELLNHDTCFDDRSVKRGSLLSNVYIQGFGYPRKIEDCYYTKTEDLFITGFREVQVFGDVNAIEDIGSSYQYGLNGVRFNGSIRTVKFLSPTVERIFGVCWINDFSWHVIVDSAYYENNNVCVEQNCSVGMFVHSNAGYHQFLGDGDFNAGVVVKEKGMVREGPSEITYPRAGQDSDNFFPIVIATTEPVSVVYDVTKTENEQRMGIGFDTAVCNPSNHTFKSSMITYVGESVMSRGPESYRRMRVNQSTTERVQDGFYRPFASLGHCLMAASYTNVATASTSRIPLSVQVSGDYNGTGEEVLMSDFGYPLTIQFNGTTNTLGRISLTGCHKVSIKNSDMSYPTGYAIQAVDSRLDLEDINIISGAGAIRAINSVVTTSGGANSGGSGSSLTLRSVLSSDYVGDVTTDDSSFVV